MNLLLQLLAQFLQYVALLCKKDGLKAVVAQNLLLKQQLIVLNRGRSRGVPFRAIWGGCDLGVPGGSRRDREGFRLLIDDCQLKGFGR